MIRLPRYFELVFFCSIMTPAFAQRPMEGPLWADPPKLVVGVVIDQMRTDMIYRYWNNFGEGGFKRLVGEGAFLRDAHFDYAPTYTGPGHASIYTGTTPAHHGIVGNDMFLRETRGGLYCAEDRSMSGVGCEGPIGQRGPVNLLSTTLADEFERRTARRSRTIGIALKDRGAILPIGRTGDAAFWFGAGAEGHFVTSDWYMDSLPRWLVEFNAEGRAKQYLRQRWDLMLPRERYVQVLPDDNPYESPLPGAGTATLPQDLAALSNGGTALITATPWGNTLTTDLAIAALAGERLGQDDQPDLLAISYSSTDILGHAVGLRALELEDMYVRLDRELERLLNELDERIGRNEYTLFLTADHAAVDVPEYLKDLRGSAGYFDQAAMRSDIEALLDEKYGAAEWVLAITNEQVFINNDAVREKGAERRLVQRTVANALLDRPGIAYAITATELSSTQFTTGVPRALQRGFMPQRSGDVCFALAPGFLDRTDAAPGKGTSHGSVWNYDTHVPVIFFGRGIRPGEVLRRTSITDIAPTIAAIAGTALPDAATGNIVQEVIATGHPR